MGISHQFSHIREKVKVHPKEMTPNEELKNEQQKVSSHYEYHSILQLGRQTASNSRTTNILS